MKGMVLVNQFHARQTRSLTRETLSTRMAYTVLLSPILFLLFAFHGRTCRIPLALTIHQQKQLSVQKLEPKAFTS